jgi:hypothetical protein
MQCLQARVNNTRRTCLRRKIAFRAAHRQYRQKLNIFLLLVWFHRPKIMRKRWLLSIGELTICAIREYVLTL